MAGEKLRILGSYFPDFAEWLKKSAQLAPDYVRLVEKRLDELPDTAIRKACEKLLLDGEIVRWQKLPMSVYALAKRYLTRVEASKWKRLADGAETEACRLCHDTGYVNVLHPETVAETLRTGQLPSFPYEAVVTCTCVKGQLILERNRMAAPDRRRNLCPYDDRRHVLRECGVLPMDQYRSLLGGNARTIKLQAGPKEIVRQLADRTRIDL